MQRYDRNSIVGLTMPTVNPCNNFIIDYLIRNKIKADKQVTNKYYMYNLAIESVKKYPLPLICEEQLAALEGFGNFFINRVGKLVKKHYLRGRMPTQDEMDEDDRDHLEGIRENMRKLKQTRRLKQAEEADHSPSQDKEMKRKQAAQIQNQSSEQSMNEEIKQNDKDQLNDRERMKQIQKFQSLMQQNDQQPNPTPKPPKSVISQHASVRQKRQTYRPRKGTQPFQILKTILQLQKLGKKPVMKGDLNQYLFNKKKEKMKCWTPVRDRLIEFGYIVHTWGNLDQVMITEKGKDYVYEVEERCHDGNGSQNSSSHSSSSSQTKKRKPTSTPKQPQSQKPRSSSTTRTYNKTSYTQLKRRKRKTLNSSHHSNPNLNPSIFHPLPSSSSTTPILLYNQNSQINQRDEDKIIQLLDRVQIEGKGVRYRGEGIPIGEFGWAVGDMVLDAVVVRVKCQGLDLDQLFLQCQRARFIHYSLVYFVFQESIVNAKSKSNETMVNLLRTVTADMRAAGFKVIKSTGIAQTISFLTKIHTQLTTNLKTPTLSPSPSTPHCTTPLQTLTTHLQTFKPALLHKITINCLKCIPNMTKQMIKKIIKKMPCFSFLYRKLGILKSDGERKKFLMWFLEDLGPKKGMVRLIVDLMFYQSYQ